MRRMLSTSTTKRLKHITLDPSQKSFSHVNFSKQRVVIIGDVHGCAVEAEELLTTYTRADDVVIFAGDIVNKGPSSCRAVDLARTNKCLGVIGNHDITSIEAFHARRKAKESLQARAENSSQSKPKSVQVENKRSRVFAWCASFVPSCCSFLGFKSSATDETSRAQKDLPSAATANSVLQRYAKYAWTDDLSDVNVSYLESLPFTIKIPYHNCIVVHAGLIPGLSLEDHDENDMVMMRNLNVVEQADTGTTYEAIWHENEGQAWASIWPGPEHVYFGHDAKRMLQQHTFATGLDSGCVYGRKLTAIILNPDKSTELVTVEAKELYVDPLKRGRTREQMLQDEEKEQKKALQ